MGVTCVVMVRRGCEVDEELIGRDERVAWLTLRQTDS